MVRPIIQPATMARMRARDERAMDSLCTIQRKPGGSDGTGAPSKAGATYANLYINVPCRFAYRGDQVEGDEILVSLQKMNVNIWALIVAYGTDLKVDDQVVGSDGIAYLVLAHSKIRTYSTNLTAYVREAGA